MWRKTESCLTCRMGSWKAYIGYKAAFDTINRKKLFMKLNIPEYLIKAVEEIYRYTPYTSGDATFHTERGLKQGCPLSPLLFAIYFHGMDEVLRKWQSGGIVVGKNKIFALAYADDIVLLATTPGNLKDMLGRRLRYSQRLDMIISTEKRKVMKFSKGGIASTERCTCGTDLGFTFQCNGGFSKHGQSLASKGSRMVSEVWSLGELKFQQSFIVFLIIRTIISSRSGSTTVSRTHPASATRHRSSIITRVRVYRRLETYITRKPAAPAAPWTDHGDAIDRLLDRRRDYSICAIHLSTGQSPQCKSPKGKLFQKTKLLEMLNQEVSHMINIEQQQYQSPEGNFCLPTASF